MCTGAAITATVGLVLFAGVTAGLWLNLLMWIPMLLLGQMRDQEQAFFYVSLLSIVVAAAAVFLFGLLVLQLPIIGAVVAGVLVGITSYARPNPAAAARC